MGFRQTLDKLVCEKKACQIILPLTNEADVPLSKAQLKTLKLTLYVSSRGDTFGNILNSRLAQNILDANGGTVYNGVSAAPDGSIPEDGELRLKFGALDNVLTKQTRGFETHVALIEWTDQNDTPGAKELSFTVANQAKIS